MSLPAEADPEHDFPPAPAPPRVPVPVPDADSPADPVGAATLERMAVAPRYNRWMFERLRPWVGRRVLEIGAGIGNMSAFLMDQAGIDRVVLTDTEPFYLRRLRERFAGRPHVSVAELRLPAVDPRHVAERLDTIVCLNVLEHIDDDRASLSALRTLLRPGGRVVLLVPALRALYGTLDRALGHVRRYVPDELSGKLRTAGFGVIHVEYFNLAGVPGWWLAGRVLRRRLIPTGALRWYDAAELPRLLQPIRDGRADAVYGSRFQGGPHRVLFFWHAVGNNLLTLVSNMLTNVNLTDMETGYKLVRADLLKRLPLTAERFGIEVALTARLAQAGARIWELPISYSGRPYAEGKKITWRDGLAALFHILRHNLFPPRGRWRSH